MVMSRQKGEECGMSCDGMVSTTIVTVLAALQQGSSSVVACVFE
jgi:hypothetical protein